MKFSLTLLLLFCSGLSGSLMAFAPGARWLEPRDAAYAALKEAADRLGDQSEASTRMRRNAPLPMSTAQVLAEDLLSDGRLQPWAKQRLRQAFRPELPAIDQRGERLRKEIAALDERIAKIQSRFDEREAAQQKNLYGANSSPSLKISMTAYAARAYNWTGPLADGGATVSTQGGNNAGMTLVWTAKEDGYTYAINLGLGSSGTNLSAPIQVSTNFSVLFDHGWLDGTEMVIGDEGSYPTLSALVFNMPAEYVDDFRDLSRLARQRSLVKDYPDSGARFAGDLYLKKKGARGWWVFDSTEVVATQNIGYSYGSNKLRDAALKVGFEKVPLFWPFEPLGVALVGMGSNNDQADLNQGLPTRYATESSSGQALVVNGSLAGGGTLYFEGATAEWERSDFPGAYRDQAFAATWTQPILAGNASLDYQYTGPQYFPGGHEQMAANAIDTSNLAPELGTVGAKQLVWHTVSSDPSIPTNNSQHLALGYGMGLGTFDLGFTLGTNQQINASNAQVASSHIVGWPRGGSTANTNGSHGFNQAVPRATYNDSSRLPGNAFPGGQWSSILVDPGLKAQREYIVMTRSGVGDATPRPDSVKYLNFAQVNSKVNFQDLLGLTRGCNLSTNWSLRNTDESLGFPLIDANALLVQSVASAKLLVDLPANFSLGQALGYETWGSRASYWPIDYSDVWTYSALTKSFPDLMDGFSMGPSFAYLRHHDAWYPNRNFEVWSAIFTATTTF